MKTALAAALLLAAFVNASAHPVLDNSDTKNNAATGTTTPRPRPSMPEVPRFLRRHDRHRLLQKLREENPHISEYQLVSQFLRRRQPISEAEGRAFLLRFERFVLPNGELAKRYEENKDGMHLRPGLFESLFWKVVEGGNYVYMKVLSPVFGQ